MQRGKIVERFNPTFEWKIPDFSLLQASSEYLSPEFEIGDSTCCIKIYPNGETVYNNGWVSLCLQKKKSECSNHIINYTLSVRDKDGEDYKRREFESHGFAKNNAGFGWSEFVKVSKLLKERNKLLPGDVLTIVCTVTCDHCDAESLDPTTRHKSYTKLRRSGIAQETLNRDMRNLFLKQRNCDVTFKVKDQELQAHRLILEARSPVFAAMFEHNMAENRSGIVVISDAEPEVFRDLLLHAYSGDEQNISSANVFELYALSEKYNFNALKQECAKFIEFNISAETVCDVLVLAHKYCDAQLNQSAEAFFRRNRSAVLESEKWKKLEKEDHLFAIEILKSIVLDGV